MPADVSIITGASRGIGRAIALKLGAEGHSLVLFGRDSEKLKSVKSELLQKGCEVLTYVGDVADNEFVQNSVNDILNKFGKIDHLINNAGVAVFKKFVETSLDEFKRQIDTNVLGVFNFTKAVLPVMISKESGSIINISSLAGKNGFKLGSTYSATKHAVMGFTKSLMLEVREYNIRVAAVCPGSVQTDLISNSGMNTSNIERILQPDDVAEVVATIIKLPVRALISEIEVRPANP